MASVVYFINHPESELVEELEKIEVEIKEAKAELIRLSGNKKERERYEKRRESLFNKLSALDSAREEGFEQGRIEIATNLIQNGLDNELISKSTGLSIKEVEELRKK